MAQHLVRICVGNGNTAAPKKAKVVSFARKVKAAVFGDANENVY